MLLAVDRQERGQGSRSAVQEVEAEFGLRCISLLTLSALIELMADVDPSQISALRAYRERYGVSE